MLLKFLEKYGTLRNAFIASGVAIILLMVLMFLLPKKNQPGSGLGIQLSTKKTPASSAIDDSGARYLRPQEHITAETAKWEAGLPPAGDGRKSALVAGLQSPDENIVARAARLIGYENVTEAGDKIDALLLSTSGLIRAAAADAAGELVLPDSSEKLKQMASHDKNPFARAAAVEALGMTGCQPAMPIILNSGKDHDKGVRNAAAYALLFLKAPKSLDLLHDMALDGYFNPSPTELFALKYYSVGQPQDQIERIKDLATVATKSIYPDTRRIAIWLYAETGGDDPAVYKPLLADKDKAVSGMAAVMSRQAEDFSTPLAKLPLLKDPDRRIRLETIFIMGNKKIYDALPDITTALQDADTDIRAAAAQAFVSLYEPKVTDQLISLLQDPSPKVRQNAIFALINQGQKKALVHIEDRLNDESQIVRDAAKMALKNSVKWED